MEDGTGGEDSKSGGSTRSGSISGKRSPQAQSSTRKLPTSAPTVGNEAVASRLSMIPPQQPLLTTGNTLPPRKPYAVDESLSLQRHRHCKHLGPTASLDASLLGLGSSATKHLPNPNMRQVSSTEYFSTHNDASVLIPDDEARALAEIDAIVGTLGPALIEIYWQNVHPSYPIIQKKAFTDRHAHGDRQFNPPLLAAMYLLALSWWDTTPALHQQSAKPDMARLEYIAITTLTVAMQRPKMSAVQAGLLLLQRAKASTWTLTVQLVALGQDIGLHLDCSDWRIPTWEKRLRKRLAWALYLQDKWSALMHGRPSHINTADWAVPAPVMEDFDDEMLGSSVEEANTESSNTKLEEEPQMRRGRMLFTQLISLAEILAEVCQTFYSQIAQREFAQAGAYATQLVLARAKPVQVKLKDWFARLPAECKMDSVSPTTGGSEELDSTGYLHLAYFATEITIHRRIIQSLTPPTTHAAPTAPAQSTISPDLLSIIRSAAKTRLISAMDFTNRLTPSHLSAFWFFPSCSNFALIATFGTLLLATAPGGEERMFYQARLREYRWTLRVSEGRAGWIGGALEAMKGLEIAAKEERVDSGLDAMDLDAW